MEFRPFFSTFYEGWGWGGGSEIYLAFHTESKPGKRGLKLDSGTLAMCGSIPPYGVFIT